jgi:hypothetical protein
LRQSGLCDQRDYQKHWIIDGLVTSRKPDNIPAFNNAIIETCKKGVPARQRFAA